MNYAAVRTGLIVAAAAAGLAVAMEFVAPQQAVDAGQDLRQTFLETSARDRGLAPTPEYPKVFAVAMEWTLDDQIATVVSMADGSASLYSTSTFGVIGGGGHPPVKLAAQKFVREAQSHFDRATPASTFPYPARTSVRFYLLGYDGVRFVEGALDPVVEGTAPLSPLFGAAQDVLTELRQVS